jgi:hypothetical protein
MEPPRTFEIAKAKALILNSAVNQMLSFLLKLIVLHLKLNEQRLVSSAIYFGRL